MFYLLITYFVLDIKLQNSWFLALDLSVKITKSKCAPVKLCPVKVD